MTLPPPALKIVTEAVVTCPTILTRRMRDKMKFTDDFFKSAEITLT